MNRKIIQDKIAIVGAGLVGSTSAFAIMDDAVASEIIMIDINQKRLDGEVMDLNHGISFVPPINIKAGSYDDIKDASMVVLTAGASQLPGESRNDLLKRNIKVFEAIVPRVVEANPDAVLLVVTNPVDVLTYITYKISGFPANRVFGSGTVLDSARFKYLLSRHCNVSAQNVHGYIIGEHGDSEVAVWSSVSIAGMKIDDYCDACDRRCGVVIKEAMAEDVIHSAYRIIEGKGSTYYAVALAVRRIVRAVIRNENSVLTVSGIFPDEKLAISLPAIVNRIGLEKFIKLPLSDNEVEAFQKSKDLIINLIKETGY